LSPGQHLLEWLPRWMQRQQARGGARPNERQAAHVYRASPAFIPRNHLIQRAIEDGEGGDFGLFHRLVERLARIPGHYDAQRTATWRSRRRSRRSAYCAPFCGT
jgi:uncharacterized protein YdiU (UPF0061 family)